MEKKNFFSPLCLGLGDLLVEEDQGVLPHARGLVLLQGEERGQEVVREALRGLAGQQRREVVDRDDVQLILGPFNKVVVKIVFLLKGK